MKLTVNSCVYVFLLCSIDFLIGNSNMRVTSMAASDVHVSSVNASVGSKIELPCTMQTSNPPNAPNAQFTWYRATNDDIKRCPNNTLYILNANSVFCDRLTINRIVQPGFSNRFSVPSFKAENENALILNRVELSDSGIYACVSNSNKTLARINLTVEEVSTQVSVSLSRISSTEPTLETSKQTIVPSSIAKIFSKQPLDVSAVASISICGAAVVIVIITIVITIVLKKRKLKEDRIEMASPNGIVSNEAHMPNEIEENEGVPRLTDNVQSIMLSHVYELIHDSYGAESGLRSDSGNAAEVICDRTTSTDSAVQDQTNQNVQSISIYELLKSDNEENEESKQEASFNLTTMTATNPVYGEIANNGDLPETKATYWNVNDMENTAPDESLCSNSNRPTLQPNSPTVGLDGTVYTELNNVTGIAPSVQPSKELFKKSVYAVIDHNGKPPPPPPSLPLRSHCSAPS